MGIRIRFVCKRKNQAHTNIPDQEQGKLQEQDVTEATDESQVNRKHADDFSIEQDDVNTIP